MCSSDLECGVIGTIAYVYGGKTFDLSQDEAPEKCDDIFHTFPSFLYSISVAYLPNNTMKKFLFPVLNQISLKPSSTLYFKAFHGTIRREWSNTCSDRKKGLKGGNAMLFNVHSVNSLLASTLTIPAYVEAAKERGYEILGLADVHSPQ